MFDPGKAISKQRANIEYGEQHRSGDDQGGDAGCLSPHNHFAQLTGRLRRAFFG
jgi:hypothetical protein